MIAQATGPLDSATLALRALYVSLNSPVVALPTLPVGPAAAAVAVHGAHAEGATLAIRSARTGTVAFYVAAGDRERAGEGVAAEAALAFAESLGFLFEEVLAFADRRWCEWLGDAGSAEAAGEPALLLSKFRWPLPDRETAAGDVASEVRWPDAGESGLDLRLELTSRF